MEENKELETVTESQRNAGKGLFLSGIIVGFAATLLVVGGIFIAFQIHRIVTVKDDVSAQVSYDEDSAVNAQTIKKLQLLEDTVKENFYLSEVTNEQLEDGMYRGLMEALDDPYSEYYTAEELNELTEQTQGIYYGIGAYVSMDSETNLPKISGVIEGAPAADVDLRANDIIYEVDGVSTAGKTLTESVSMIRGEAGTTVDLTIVRQGAGDYLHVTVERAKVESPTVKYEMLDDNMAYIQIVEFDDVTIDQFTDALATVKGSGMEGLILDLRGNPGGSLDAVVQIARKLLPEGMIVYTEDKAGKRTEYTCDGKTPLEVPLVVLVDMNSASASEMGLPLIISVAIDEDAIALPQPKVSNFTSSILLSLIFRYIFMMSPHLALPTSPTPSASAISPTFRGCRKWSITVSVYKAIINAPLHYRMNFRLPDSRSFHMGDMFRRYATMPGTFSRM